MSGVSTRIKCLRCFPHGARVTTIDRSQFVWQPQDVLAEHFYAFEWTYAGGLNPIGFKWFFAPHRKLQPTATFATGFIVSTPWKYFPGFRQRMEDRRKAFLLWRSLPMMRRYLEANRRAKSAVSHGYRELNFWQKTVAAAFAKPERKASDTVPPPGNPSRSAN